VRVLVVNTGSSSLKLQLIDEDDAVEAETHVERWDGDESAFVGLLEGTAGVDAVGHRVVHGGHDLVEATVVTDDVVATIDNLTSLAPLHQPRAVAGLDAGRRALPSVPHVACFDTAFHASMPVAARTYALPPDWRGTWGLDRFGFHGLSHAWAARRGPTVAGRPAAEARRVVSCHLGAGASLCAIADGRSVETTMGFTPLEGVVMATRSGSVDPGLLLWLQTEAGLSAEDVRDGLEHRSGLAGLSGTSGDMRDVLARRTGGDPSGALAFDVYVHRLRAGIGAMAAALDGLDVLVFTGGVGEHAAEVRSACAEGLGYLGVGVDAARNEAASTDADVSASGAAASIVVVTAREDLEIARQVRHVLG
jgi:acetate kinase